MSVKQALLAGADKIGEAVFSIDRMKYLPSSQALDCLRKLWYERNQPDDAAPQDWGFARRGKMVEEYVVRALRAAPGISLAFAGEDQESLADDDTRMSATPDGALEIDGDWYGLEIKSFDPRTNTNKLPKKAHTVQAQIAAELMIKQRQLPLQGVWLVYVNASNLNDIHEFYIERDPDILTKLAPRAHKLLTTKVVDHIDREGRMTGLDCKYCPFTAVCGVVVDDPDRVRRANRGSGMDAAVLAYTTAKRQIEDLEAQQRQNKEEITRQLKQRNTNELTVGDYVVELQTVKGRASLDRKAVAKAGIDLSPFETIGAASERLTVTLKG